MSILNKDHVDSKSRRNILKDFDADLLDQIPARLLNKARELNLGVRARKIWSTGNSERQEWLDRQRTYLRDWDEFLESTSQGPFAGSSTLHVPMPFTVAKTFHARMLGALIGDDFRFSAKARREDSAIREKMVSDVMRYALKDWSNDFEGVVPVLDDFVWAWVTSGVGLLKWRWDTKVQKWIDVEPTLVTEDVEEVDADGNLVTVPTVVTEDREIDKVEEIFNGPVLETVDPEDLLFLGDSDPQKADVTVHRIWLTASDLWSFADRKLFDKSVIEKIIKSGPDNKTTGIATEIKQDRAFNAGLDSGDTDADLDRYQFLETYWNIDIDNSGINSQIVTWSHEKTGELTRATYTRRISPNGKNPFFKSDFFRRRNQQYGIGLVEILHPLSVEIDAMHNLNVDSGVLRAMPFGFYRASSSIDPETIQLSPGALIPVDDPQTDVSFPSFQGQPSFFLQQESQLNVMVERLTGISDLTLGVLSGNQGAARTATGARAIVGESATNLNVNLGRLVRTWNKSLNYLFNLLQKRIPSGLSFRVTGDDGDTYWQEVKNRNDLIGDFDFEISSNSAQSNPQVRQQAAQQILQLASNPLAIQLGIVTPGNFYEAMKNFVQSFEVRDFNRFFTRPREFSVQLSPQEEFNRVINGINVPVTPEMDHQGFIDFFQFILSNPEQLGQYSQEAVLRVQAQADAHSQMLAAMRDIQAQAANARQAQINAAQSIQQTAPGGGALGGLDTINLGQPGVGAQ